MFQSSARDEALIAVVRTRGLVRGDQLDQLLAGSGPGGLAHSLRSALPPEQLAAVHDTARRCRFVCARGCVSMTFDDLAPLASLVCPRCGGGLRVDGGPPATGGFAARPSDRHEPRVIAGYEVVEELGRGSFGVVYKVRRPGLERPFALKVLLKTDVEPDLLARFRLEAQIASKLEHPGIVGVFDAGLHGERPYLVMAYCPGETLKDRLRQGPLPPADAARLVAEIARAVAYAHEHGVLHRDLKPANIILEAGTGRPLVTDFGLARDRSLARSMTRTGDVIGTPAYAAPEQLRGERDVDRRIDVWALGVILYECLTGQRPFVGADVVSLAQHVLHGPLRPPRELEPAIPEALQQVVLRALDRERFRRTSTAAELADALEALAGESSGPSRSRSTSRRRAVAAPGPPRPGSRRALVGAAVGLALTVGLVLAGRGALDAPPAADAPPTTSEVAATVPPPTPPPAPPPSVATEPALPERPKERAPDGDLAPVLDAAARALRLNEYRNPVDEDAIELLLSRGPDLAARYPDDGRAVFVGAYARLLKQEDELAARRELVRSLALDPPAPEALRDRVARVSYTLGFQRAAADALEPLFRGDRLPEARPCLNMVMALAKSTAPVQDPARALHVARLALRASDEDMSDGEREDDQPRGSELRTTLAELLLYFGDKDGAVRLYREAAETILAHRRGRGRGSRWAAALNAAADELEGLQGDLVQYGYDVPLRRVSYDFPTTPLLELLAAQERRADAGDERAAAAELVARAEQGQGSLGAPRAAVLLVTASRWYERGRQPDEALRALERAAALDLSGAHDVRALVLRRLALTLLERDPARAERLALEAVTAADDPGCTVGERADAWVLVGAARRARGDAAGVRGAAAKVADLRPHDVRGVDALRDGRPLTSPPQRPPAQPAPAAEPPPDLDALLADTARVIRLNERRAFDDAAMSRLLRAAPALNERARQDPRAAFVVAFAAVLGGSDELAARRELVRALRATDGVPSPARDRVARLCHALGFERAAADLLEPIVAGDRPVDPEQGLCLLQTYTKSAPPVQDVGRAIELARRTLQARAADARDGDALMPPTWDLHANLAELLLFQRDDAAAAQVYRDAAASTRDPQARGFFVARAESIAAGTLGREPYDVPGRIINFHFPLTDFLRRVLEARALADRERTERTSAAALLGLARREAAERPDRAALVWVMGAHLLARVGDHDGALKALEDAAALSLPAAAVDVRALVARTLGRALVERDPVRAERLGLEAAQVPDGEPLTAGERADAWEVVGLARRARGDAAGAKQAAERGAACGPFDRRGLDALAR